MTTLDHILVYIFRIVYYTM